MRKAASWRPSEHVVFSPMGDSLALLDSERNVYYSLDGIGPFLWERVSQGLNFEALCDATVATFDVDQATAEADIAEWIAAMSGSGLICECFGQPDHG